jgi:hypothetical protein
MSFQRRQALLKIPVAKILVYAVWSFRVSLVVTPPLTLSNQHSPGSTRIKSQQAAVGPMLYAYFPTCVQGRQQ